jgi:colanic acid biosynthesis glycosyl transferase WcaI
VRIVALTRAFKENLERRGIDGGKIGVVINGVELSRYAPREKDLQLAKRWGLDGQCFVVGYIGTHGMAHALDNVLDAAALDGDSDIRFLFVGGGAEQKRLIAKAQRIGLQNVVFVPAQPKETMPAYWSLCDVALVHLKDTRCSRLLFLPRSLRPWGWVYPSCLRRPRARPAKS